MNNSPTVVHAHRIKIHLLRPIFGVARSNGCVDPPARIIAEPSLANSDRLSHFGRRMSLFLRTLILLGILFDEQKHRQERNWRRDNAVAYRAYHEEEKR